MLLSVHKITTHFALLTVFYYFGFSIRSGFVSVLWLHVSVCGFGYFSFGTFRVLNVDAGSQ